MSSNAPQTGHFVEMIGLGSISQPTGLKSASTWSLGSGPVPCTALRSAPERALTVDHIALGSIVWRTLGAARCQKLAKESHASSCAKPSTRRWDCPERNHPLLLNWS